MKKITDKEGELKLSPRKILNMSVIVAFFSMVAHSWERKRRREFKKAVKYREYDTARLKAVLADFKELVTCVDPYIEHFYLKQPDFSSLHKLWVLNSHAYWTKKFEEELKRREAV
ncbi:MAG TPA: hypothetical protein P5161_04795 [Eubacteriales bacterium]|jgi:hypothetical protein|nr:hypothetical protein [Clostridia bacterium]HRR90076.1 hypothetical protein [Eubacteriales bacterium]HRU83925.1 hypothetical protein [Eubacteriales bacterium]